MNITNFHIGLVGPLPPPSGGMANQTRQLTQLLRDEGVTVEVIQVNKPYFPQWVGRLKGIRAIFRLIAYIAQLWQVANHVQLFHVMANSGWSWHLFAAPVIWIGKLKGVPVIINYRGGEAGAFFDKSFFWVKPSLDRTTEIIVPSGFLQAVFSKRGYTTRIVPNIIDLSRFSPKEGSDHSLLQKDVINILATRNLEPIYDNATVLRAFKLVKEKFSATHLIIAGSGFEEGFLKKLAKDLDIEDSVTFTGRIDNKDMPALYQNADIMVNGSLVDNMPISILEALACGTPIVSTNVGGIPQLVEHERTALLVGAKDHVAMADALCILISDKPKRIKIRENGLESINQYTWFNVKNRLLPIYNEIVK